MDLEELKRRYQARKGEIERRLAEFKRPKTNQQMFDLLVSCILSSNTKWKSVKKTMDSSKKSGAHLSGTSEEIRPHLGSLSGRYLNKDKLHKLADYIVGARKRFPAVESIVRGILNSRIRFEDGGVPSDRMWKLYKKFSPTEWRRSLEEKGLTSEHLRWFVKTIDGVGDKQASHFLRGIGFDNYAILDTHVLSKLVKCGVIEEKPKSLTHKTYIEIETKMKDFANKQGIPFPHLDLLFWEAEP